jgi:hypothetical protein
MVELDPTTRFGHLEGFWWEKKGRLGIPASSAILKFNGFRVPSLSLFRCLRCDSAYGPGFWKTKCTRRVRILIEGDSRMPERLLSRGGMEMRLSHGVCDSGEKQKQRGMSREVRGRKQGTSTLTYLLRKSFYGLHALTNFLL